MAIARELGSDMKEELIYRCKIAESAIDLILVCRKRFAQRLSLRRSTKGRGYDSRLFSLVSPYSSDARRLIKP